MNKKWLARLTVGICMVLQACTPQRPLWADNQKLLPSERSCALNESMFPNDWQWLHTETGRVVEEPAAENNYRSLLIGSIVTGLYGEKRAYIDIISKVEVFESSVPAGAIDRIPTPDRRNATAFTPAFERVGQSHREECVRHPGIGLDCVLTGTYGRLQATIQMLAPARLSDADVVAILNPITRSLNSCMMGFQH